MNSGTPRIKPSSTSIWGLVCSLANSSLPTQPKVNPSVSRPHPELPFRIPDWGETKPKWTFSDNSQARRWPRISRLWLRASSLKGNGWSKSKEIGRQWKIQEERMEGKNTFWVKCLKFWEYVHPQNKNRVPWYVRGTVKQRAVWDYKHNCWNVLSLEIEN